MDGYIQLSRHELNIQMYMSISVVNYMLTDLHLSECILDEKYFEYEHGQWVASSLDKPH